MLSRERGFGLGLGGGFFDNIVLPLIIVAVLAAIAIPAYRTHAAKARIARALEALEPGKAAIERALAARADPSQAWQPAAAPHATVAVEKSGAIVLRFDESVAPGGANELRVVPLAAGGKLAWKCPGAGTTLEAARLPSVCRP